jgi:hypothetical protein
VLALQRFGNRAMRLEGKSRPSSDGRIAAARPSLGVHHTAARRVGRTAPVLALQRFGNRAMRLEGKSRPSSDGRIAAVPRLGRMTRRTPP